MDSKRKRAAFDSDGESAESDPRKRRILNEPKKAEIFFPLRLSGLKFEGVPLKFNANENLPKLVAKFIPISQTSFDILAIPSWSPEMQAFIYHLESPFTFSYNRKKFDHRDEDFGFPESGTVVWDSHMQAPRLFLHPAVERDLDDLENTSPFKAWLYDPDKVDGSNVCNRTKSYDPPFKLWTCDNGAEILNPTRASRYCTLCIDEMEIEPKSFALPREDPLKLESLTKVIWTSDDAVKMWGVRVRLTPIPLRFDEYGYRMQAAVEELYVKIPFFATPGEELSKIEKEIEYQNRGTASPQSLKSFSPSSQFQD